VFEDAGAKGDNGLARAGDELQGVIADTMTRTFRPAFVVAALLALLALVPALVVARAEGAAVFRRRRGVATIGIAVAGLNFPGYAEYAAVPAEGATNVAAFEFPLWVASQFESVDEVEAALRDVAIVDRPINEKYPSSLLHWIIGDSERAIVVEYTAGGMHVFDDDVDVLANQPGFSWHHENLRNYLNATPDFPEDTVLGRAHLEPFGSGSHMRGIPGDYYSPSRFVRAAYVNAHYPQKSSEEENVSRAFHTLQQVAMVDGCAAMGSGEFEKTIYTGLFSSRTNTYYWNTYEDPAIQSVAMADHSPDGTELAVV
jgi:choloylglycine hydrolase